MPALFTKHRRQALAIATGFYLPGGERQDIEQEALIGLWIAARKWDPEGGASFRTFAELVIRRRLGAIVKAALREKHRPLNDSVRCYVTDEGEEVAIIDVLPGGLDPLEVVVLREKLVRLGRVAGGLSPLEREALQRAADGVPYTAGYAKDKRVDNAVQRARRKLKAAAS